MGSPTDRDASMRVWGGLAIGLALGVGFVWSYGTWPDPTIDFGRELYVPARLGAGDVLYRDVVSFNGPLSPYLIAGGFWLTGPSFLALVGQNFFVLLALIWLVFVLMERMAGTPAAVLCGLTIVGAFAFGHLVPAGSTPMGNFNWLAPYSHEITHGLVLALLSLYLLERFEESGARGWLVACGLALGLAFLTKAEVFLAGAAGVSAGFLAHRWQRRGARGGGLREAAWLVLGAGIPIVLSTVLLALAMPVQEAVRGTLGTWAHIGVTEHVGLPFFAWGLGFDAPGQSLLRVGVWSSIYAAFFGAAAWLAWARPPVRSALAWSAAGGAALIFLLWMGLGWIGAFDPSAVVQWQDAPQPWACLVGAALAVHVAWLVGGKEIDGLALRIAWLAMALVLLAKMILNVRIHHYGFALALPAACAVVATLFAWAPSWLEGRGAEPGWLRGAFLGAWSIAMVAAVAHASANWSAQSVAVGQGADRFFADERGEALASALTYLNEHAEAGASLVALPEGILLNYLAGARSTTPFVQYTPPLIALYGEATMLSALEADPPEWIAYVHRSDADYGLPYFGRDYGQQLAGFVTRGYRVVHRVGAAPFRGPDFGLVLFERRR